MKDYEITFISKVESDSGVEKLIESLGGKVSSFKDLGRKNFTYSIQKQTAGFYFTVRFNFSSLDIANLNKKLLQNTEILRFLIVNLPMNKITQQAQNLEKAIKIKEAKEVEVESKSTKELNKEERTKMVDEQLEKLLGKE